MRLFVQSFGCQMSVADGDELARPLLARGLRPVSSPEEADVAIVNTCTVRQHAEDRAVSYIGRLRVWKEARPGRLLIVAGCAAQRLGDRLKGKYPFIDLVVGAKSIEQYPDLLEMVLRDRRPAGGWTPSREKRGAVSAFVTIMRGCNYSCSYCIVPSVRGRELHRPREAVLSEVRSRVAAGAREVVLLGQTVNSYRPPDGGDFADLLRALEAEDGLLRVRFMSPHPYYLDDRMIRAMAESPKVCPHMHLPLQSGSDPVLRRMRRNYSAEEFLDKAGRLRRAVPAVSLTTDFIVGFPGETEDDFRRTLDVARRLDPDAAYCFQYSPRPSTEAARFSDDVPLQAREERLQRLLEEVEARTLRHLEALRGKRVRVLLEDGRAGRTQGCFTALLDEPGIPGELLEAEVTGSTRNSLLARKVV